MILKESDGTAPEKLNSIENVNEVEITETIKELSKLKTLSEMIKTAQDKGSPLVSPSSLGGATFLGGTPGITFFSPSPTVKAHRAHKPIMFKKRAVKKPKVLAVDKKPRSTRTLTKLEPAKGIRKSLRLLNKAKNIKIALNEADKIGTNIRSNKSIKKPLLDNSKDKININDVRRMVKKSIARNKLTSY